MEAEPGRPTISGRLLAQHLRAKYDTLRFEWRDILPPVDPDARPLRYDYAAITAFLNRDVRGFAEPPSAEALLGGKLKLLTPDEVVERIPHLSHRKVVEVWARRGKMAALKLGGQIRLEESSVMRVAAPPARFTAQQVCHILGVRQWVTLRRQLIETGRLETVLDAEAGGHFAITRQSLVELLGGADGLLPQGTDPEDWIDDREAIQDPLLLTADAMRFTGEGIHRFKRLVTDGTLRFVWSPKKKERHFCPESLLVYVEQFPLKNVEIAHVYGMTRSAVRLWRQDGLMNCTLHHHFGGDAERVYKACLIEMLGGQLSPGMNPANWLANRMGTKLGLMQLPEAAAALGMERAQLIAAAKSGEIGGIRTPTGGNWAFSRQRIERLERRRRQAAEGH